MKLVASAIVHNEADRYLKVWLEHLLEFCDRVVLLNDHSTDATREIAFGYDRVTVFDNTGVRFMHGESDARNLLIEHTLRVKADYVLSIDADEFIGDTDALRAAIESHRAVYAVTMREAWKLREHEIGLRVDGLWGDRTTHMLWRTPGRPVQGSRWRIPTRKLACGREPLEVRRTGATRAGLAVYHFGWTREAERLERAQRYFDHDQGKFHADKHLQSILWPDEPVGVDGAHVVLNWQPWPRSIPTELLALTGRGMMPA